MDGGRSSTRPRRASRAGSRSRRSLGRGTTAGGKGLWTGGWGVDARWHRAPRRSVAHVLVVRVLVLDAAVFCLAGAAATAAAASATAQGRTALVTSETFSGSGIVLTVLGRARPEEDVEGIRRTSVELEALL